MKTDRTFFGMVLAVLVLILIFAIIVWVIQMLWNGLLTQVTICDKITYLQAFGLFILASLLTMDKSKLVSWLYE